MEIQKKSGSTALNREEFSNARQDVRDCWRKLGMLQLRMTNDLYLGASRLPDAQIKAQLVQAREAIQGMIDSYFPEK